MKRILKKYRFILIFTLLLGTFFLASGSRQQNSNSLRVSFLDVGQGDAEFFETPGGMQVLIDGGPKQEVVRRLDEIMPFWDRSLDLVILTHPQLDHLSGLIPVLERYRIGRIILNEAAYRLDAYATLLDIVERKHIPITLAHAGEVLRFDHGIVGRILNPTDDVVAKKLPYDINETSVVLRLDYGKTSFLFTGDAGFYTEDRLASSGAPLDVDILKVGHHGSKYASGEEFLRAVSPRIAVIEVGAKNTYGHPTTETLSRLATVGATIFRTDQDGTVTLETDGKTVSNLLTKDYGLFRSIRTQMLFVE